MKSLILGGLVVALGGLLAALTLAGAGDRCPAPAASRPAAQPDGALAARLDELARTVGQLADLQRECAARATTPMPDAALPQELARLSAVVEQLRAELALARGEIARGPIATRSQLDLADVRRLYPTTDWLAWDRFVSTWRADPRSAVDSMRFLTPAGLLERYGPPTRVRGEEQGEVRWTYGPEGGGADSARDYSVTLSLIGGYVCDARVYAP